MESRGHSEIENFIGARCSSSVTYLFQKGVLIASPVRYFPKAIEYKGGGRWKRPHGRLRWYLLPEEGEEPPFTRVGEDCWWTEVVGRDGRKRRRDIYLNSLDASRRYEYDAILNVKTPVGKEPKDMAAAALYMACRANNESCTQKDVAEASGTSEVTLRIRLKDLEEVVDKRGGLKKFIEP